MIETYSAYIYIYIYIYISQTHYWMNINELYSITVNICWEQVPKSSKISNHVSWPKSWRAQFEGTCMRPGSFSLYSPLDRLTSVGLWTPPEERTQRTHNDTTRVSQKKVLERLKAGWHIVGGMVVSICLSFSMREMMIKIELRLGWLEATPVTYLFRVRNVRNFSRELGLSQKGCYPKRYHGHPWPNIIEGWNMTINHQFVFFPNIFNQTHFKNKRW